MIHPNAADTVTVRSVFIVGPDKKVKLTITYPAEHRAQLPGDPAGPRLAAAHCQVLGLDPGGLEGRRGRHHRPRHHGRAGQGEVPQGLECCAALPASDSSAQQVTPRSARRPVRRPSRHSGPRRRRRAEGWRVAPARRRAVSTVAGGDLTERSQRRSVAMPTAVIVDAVRTAGGKRHGKLSGWHPVDLAAETLKALVERNDLDPALDRRRDHGLRHAGRRPGGQRGPQRRAGRRLPRIGGPPPPSTGSADPRSRPCISPPRG